MNEYVSNVQIDDKNKLLEKIEMMIKNNSSLIDIKKEINKWRTEYTLIVYTYFDEFTDLVKFYARRYKNLDDSNPLKFKMITDYKFFNRIKNKSRFMNPITYVFGLFALNLKTGIIDQQKIFKLQAIAKNQILASDIFRYSRWWKQQI